MEVSKNKNRQAVRRPYAQSSHPGKNQEADIQNIEEDEPSFSWEAPEYDHEEKHPRWYLTMGGILLAVIVYALVTNSILMAITFILIGTLGYVYAEREPRNIQMDISPDGVRVDNYFYRFEDLKSFWIFYETEENIKILSLHSKKNFLPHIHVPIGTANPILIREVLVQYLPEIRQELTIIDRLERIIGL
ncbi:MAG: hypothetical protein WC831_05330 [Parcubacteria group bacterium]|jgi:hypothetical protein